MSFLESRPPTFVSAVPGSYAETDWTFASLTEFSAARLERVDSREQDFGLAWRNCSAVYRAAWIADTGELYIVQLGAPEQGGGHVELLAAGAGLERTERALWGWRRACCCENSLTWLRKRAARLDGPVSPRA